MSCHWNACYAAPVTASCDTCPLKLLVLGKTVSASGSITSVELAIDYDPQPGEPRPRMVDFRVYSSKPVTLTAAVAGQALAEADKQLYTDPVTGQPWKRRADRSYELLVLSLSNTNTLVPGRIVTLTFSLDDPGPVPFRILPRAQVFAPPDADAALNGTSYGDAVVVTHAD